MSLHATNPVIGFRFPRRTICLLLAVSVSAAAADRHSWRPSDLLKSSTGQTLHFEQGRRPNSILSKEYGSLLLEDTRDILTSPLRWNRRDWLVAGGLTGLVVMSAAFDAGIKEESQETVTPQRHAITKNAQRFGAEGSWLVIGAFEAYGRIAGDSKARAVAMDSVSSSIIAAGIVTPLIKFTAGRVRPNASDHAFHFKPLSGNYSFPSGHVTQAFAVASVISAHYDRWWVHGLAYGVAGAVGYSRIEQNSHYASDVVAGAIIGTVVGRTIVKRHNRPRKPDAFSLRPYMDGRGSGLVFSKDF